jgi:acyl carrier protein
MSARDEIQNQVRDALVEALGVEEEEVVAEAVLTKDLGAESIDFLDILFRLEKAFKIKIPKDDIFPQSILSNREYVENGKLKKAGLTALREQFPYLDYTSIEARIDSFDMQDLFTVSMLETYVQHRLGPS